MGRKEAREEAFKILYQVDIQKEEDFSHVLEIHTREYPAERKKDQEYIDDVVNGVFVHVESLDRFISEGVKSWTLNRISKVDKAILRLALYEIFYRDDIPDSISIFEAVELIKKYDSEEAGGFVNGILRSILRKSGKDE